MSDMLEYEQMIEALPVNVLLSQSVLITILLDHLTEDKAESEWTANKFQVGAKCLVLGINDLSEFHLELLSGSKA